MKIVNEFVEIDIVKNIETQTGTFSILNVHENENLFCVFFRGRHHDRSYDIEISINSVKYKKYSTDHDYFYVLLKKITGFFEVIITDSNDLDSQDVHKFTLQSFGEFGSIKVLKPRISVYSICWNEAKLLPFFLNHYAKFASKITIYDNESNDGSAEVVKIFKKCKTEVITYSTNDKIDDLKYMEIKNNCWKSDPAEYVVVCDIDEFLYSTNMYEYLKKNSECEVFTPCGKDMISDFFPIYSLQITEQCLFGVERSGLNKNILFKGNLLFEINYTPGCHTSFPIGFNVRTCDVTNSLKLLHYKRLSLDYYLERTFVLRDRLSEFNILNGAGSHYMVSKELLTSEFNQNRQEAVQVIENSLLESKKTLNSNYVYIDCGARIGEAVEILLDSRPELLGCTAYMFECNPAHIDSLNKLRKENEKYNLVVRQEAVWNENCEMDFYISNDIWGDLGCTLKPEKHESLDRANPIKVKCIDLSEFIRSFDDEYLILKLDVEGAEYEILEHLINEGTIDKINELYVEFHDSFFNKDSQKLKEKIKSLNIKYDFNWM